jgi:hypothetical protein
MDQSDLKEITDLALRMASHEPVGQESEEAIERVAQAREPSALPDLRRALAAALEYQEWAQEYADSIPADVKKSMPGGWMIDSLPVHGANYAELLRSAIEECTPEGDPVRFDYE